ncbi:hypothetical protein Tco_1316149 [Tanacetum coccineum]
MREVSGSSLSVGVFFQERKRSEVYPLRRRYLGGFWVLILRLGSSFAKEKLLKHVGVASWFTELLPANDSFVSDERLVWISIEGLPIKTWTHNTFAKIVSPWGVMADVDTDADDPALPFKKLACALWLRVKELKAWSPDFSNDDSDNSSSDKESVNEEHVSNTCDFQNEKEDEHVSESSCMKDNGVELKKHGTSDEPRPISENPFGIYDLLNKNAAKQDSKGDDPIFPLGFTQDAIDGLRVENIDEKCGSILDVIEGLVEVGQTMGFNMEGCLKNIEAIISIQGDCQVFK